MLRKIIKIDEEKCNGCGMCVSACHEGAIGLINGKAKLLRDDYCDGLGNCLPVCPTGAITFEERDTLEYDEQAVKANMEKKSKTDKLPCGCPGTNAKAITHKSSVKTACIDSHISETPSQLNQWPVQIKLVPVNAPYFNNAKLLIAADCTAYAYGGFHDKFMKNKVTLIGCPKLDEGDYTEKLTAILKENNIKSVTVVRMEVPCCAGIANAAMTALKNSGKMIPWQVMTLTTDGQIIED
ncbi:MAG: 4Fe-4S binding protein [Clostridiales bacterium]|nr:4Fe-4S binding protein [Clostridiales bacterium]